MAETPEEIARKIAERFFVEDEWSQEPLAERIAAALTRVREETIAEQKEAQEAYGALRAAVARREGREETISRERELVAALEQIDGDRLAGLAWLKTETVEQMRRALVKSYDAAAAIRALSPKQGDHQ